MPTTRQRRPRASQQRIDVSNAVLSQPWLISPQGLERVLSHVHTMLAQKPSAVEAQESEYLTNSWSTTVRDGIAQLRVYGPLVAPSAGWLRYYFASYEDIAAEINRVLVDSSVKALVITWDSPGGHVAGCHEFAQIIRHARDVKPIVAFVEGDACSAAYWGASACREVVASETAVIGCLGAQTYYVDATKLLEEWGVREIVITSSQTPDKNRPPIDKEGHAQWQRMIDNLAAVFLDDVAANRGVTRDVVDERYGRGAVLVGQEALAAGMVDRIATYEELHQQLLDEVSGSTSSTTSSLSKDPTMTKLARAGAKAPKKPAAGAPAAKNTPKPAAAAAAGEEDTDDDEDDEDDEDEDAAASGSENTDDDEDDEDDDEEKESASRSRSAAQKKAITTAVNAEHTRIVGILALRSRASIDALMPLIADRTCTPESAAHRLMTGEAKGLRNGALANLASEEATLQQHGGLSSVSADERPVTGTDAIVNALRVTNPRALTESAAQKARPTRGA